ncbi:hypothetical protein [Desertivirga xinjiangensis]|uniref:hypothetical protein n=1 Tax=Desertivirga xinjiangensis TaxID=539206 RepID=UPI00210DD9D9|nr:hypothetical protein [Pedobacter xinjiangensis]
MRHNFFILAILVVLTACKKDNGPGNEPEVKELQVLGWSQAKDNTNFVPTLWTGGGQLKRQLSFLPILNDARYRMAFSSQLEGKPVYFGIEDTQSPSNTKAVMWQGAEGGLKTILSEKTLHLVQQERINGFSVNPLTNDIYVLASDRDYYYYYEISDGGNSIVRTSVNAGAHGEPVYIQASGADIHLLTVTQIYSDAVPEGKTIIRHLKNDVLYATYEIALNEEEYLWNNLFVGTATIENNVCHLLAVADQSRDYYYLKLSKDVPVVQKPIQIDGYTPSFGSETGSITSGSGVFENGHFYLAARRDARDVACLIVDVRPEAPTTRKVVLEAPQLYTTYTAFKTYKYGDDIYINGVADSFGVYWKNGKLVVPDNNGLNMSRIGYISFQ